MMPQERIYCGHGKWRHLKGAHILAFKTNISLEVMPKHSLMSTTLCTHVPDTDTRKVATK